MARIAVAALLAAGIVSVASPASASGFSISGVITGEGAGNLDGARACATGAPGTFCSDPTGISGAYSVILPSGGSYTLDFSAPLTDFVDESWNNVYNLDTGTRTPINVTGNIAGYNAELALGTHISGTVTGSGGAPLASVTVRADDTSAYTARLLTADTDASGNYTIWGIPAGSYRLSFNPPFGTYYVPEFWNDSFLLSGADSITVAAGVPQAGLATSLGLGGYISGNVKVDPGINLAGAFVNIYTTTGDFVTNAITDAAGDYTARGLAPGDYKVQFTGPFGGSANSEWWNDKETQQAADPITVTPSTTTTGKDAVLGVGASISGNVKGASSTNLEGASVFAVASNGSYQGVGITDVDGNYRIAGLPADSYTLSFVGPEGSYYVAEWWNDHVDQLNADYFTVAAGATVTGRDAVLALGSSISGNVKGGSPAVNLDGASVDVYDSTGNFIASGTTDASGDYVIAALPVGTYTLRFRSPASASYIAEWWDDKGDFAVADFFPTTAGATMTGMDAVLAAGGTISGTVTGGSPPVNLVGARVFAYNAAGDVVANALTDASGNYAIKGLPADTYTLFFRPKTGTNFIREFWDNKPTFAAADFFTVSAGTTVSGRNANLAKGSIISGSLTDASGTPLSGAVAVYASDGSGSESFDNLVSGAVVTAGTYSVVGLLSGSYKVAFTTDQNAINDLTGTLLPSTPYLSEWYNNKYSYSTASVVVLSTPEQEVTGINGTLENPRFADVGDPTSSFYPYIEWMGSTGISTGTVQPSGKPLYKPGDAVSRQAMALFMYRLSGVTTFVPPVSPSFADVPTSSPFFTAIEWMKSAGISTGTPQPSGPPLYKPVDPVSRQAMALFVARYAGASLGTPPTIQRFADVPISASAAAAIDWMYVNGISTGTPQPPGLPLYKPTDPVSRQAMAAFLFRVDHLP